MSKIAIYTYTKVIIILLLTMILIYANILFFLKLFNYPNQFVKNNRMDTNKLIEVIAKKANLENKHIILMQEGVAESYQKFKMEHALSHQAYHTLNMSYQFLNPFNLNNKEQWHLLMSRLDVVPPSLLIAIALYNIQHSTDGKPKNYNFFKNHCNTLNCGIPSKTGEPYIFTGYANYINLRLAINEAIYAFNAASEYSHWRQVRELLRNEHQALSSYKLADALIDTYGYNSQSINEIKSIITKYSLTRFDQSDTPNKKCILCRNYIYY